MEQSLRQEMAKLDKLHHSNNELQAVPSCGRSFAGDLLDSKSTSGGLLSVFGSHTFCSHVMDVQEPNRSVSQQCRVWNCVAWRRFTHGWFYQLFVSGSVCWKLCLVKRQRRSLSVTNARESFRRVHILTFVYLSPLLPENLHGSHSTQLYIFEDSAAVDHKINKGRSPSRHATRTHKVDLDWLFEREWIWIILCWSSTCEQQIHWRIFWTKGKFATMQWHSLMNVWQIRRPHESNDVRSFCRKPFSCSASVTLQAMSQAMTLPENVDQIWSQCVSQVLSSGYIQGNMVTLEQLFSRHQRLSCRHAPQNDCQKHPPTDRVLVSNLAKQKKIVVRQLVQSTINCRQCTRQKFTSSQILFYVWEKQAVNMPEIVFNMRWKAHLEQHRESSRKIMENKFNSYSTYF